MPYLSLHEFEAPLFSNSDIMKEHFFDHDATSLIQTTLQYPNPEMINGGEQTAPSKRILQCIPEYAKPIDGVAIAQKTGLDVLRAKCSHFDNWIKGFEGLKRSQPR